MFKKFICKFSSERNCFLAKITGIWLPMNNFNGIKTDPDKTFSCWINDLGYVNNIIYLPEEILLNLNNNPQLNQLREIIKNGDITKNNILWINKNGEVILSLIDENKTLQNFKKENPNMRFGYDVFSPGIEFIGEDAANDKDWIQEIFTSLIKTWNNYTEKTLENKFIR